MDVPLKDMVKGVQCPACENFGMRHIHGSWFCGQCGALSKDAHISAIQDYFHLYGDSITNKDLRDFLNLDSAPVARRILHSLDLIQRGTNKGRSYLPSNNFFS